MRLLKSFGVSLALAACTQNSGPQLCSPDGLVRLKSAGASDEVVAKACPDNVRPGATPQPQPKAEPEPPQTWKVQPTPLSVIKTDPPSFLEKPTLVLVAVKPSDYFNYGYGGARTSHFAFELRGIRPDGRVGDDQLYGYAARSWARPFFEKVNQRLQADGGKHEYVVATMVVAYLKKRHDESTSDHVEILGAAVGQDFSLSPTPFAEKFAQEAAAGAARREAKDAVKRKARAQCPDETIRHVFTQSCEGSFMYRVKMGGQRPTFDTNYFCRCAANMVDLDWARDITEGCSFPDSGELVRFIETDAVVLACRR